MTTEKEYDAFVAKLTALEKTCGCKYLTDENVDAENVTVSRDDPSFWTAMLSAAKMAAGIRAEEDGLDINELLGEIVY